MSELTASMLLRGADQKLAVIRVELIKDLGTQIAPQAISPATGAGDMIRRAPRIKKHPDHPPWARSWHESATRIWRSPWRRRASPCRDWAVRGPVPRAVGGRE